MDSLSSSKSVNGITAKELIFQYKQKGLFDSLKNNILEKDISLFLEEQEESSNISKLIEKFVAELVNQAVNNDNSLIADSKRNKQETISKLENELSLNHGKDIKALLQKLLVENDEMQIRIQSELSNLYKSSLNM